MPLTPEEQYELQMLEEEARVLGEETKSLIANAALYPAPSKPGITNRAVSGVGKTLEYSGVLPAVRAGAAIWSKKNPDPLDFLQLILMGGGAGIAKAVGVPASMIAKAAMGSAAAAGGAQALVGPEAGELGQKILEKGGEKPSTLRKIAAGAVSEAPAIAGSIVGPAAIGRGVGLAAKVAQKQFPRMAPFLEGTTTQLNPEILPMRRAQEAGIRQGVKTGEYVPEEGLREAGKIESDLGVPLTPYQTQYVAQGKKSIQTELGDTERSLQKTGEAETFAQRQEEAFRKTFEKRLEGGAPGFAGREAADIGAELQAGVSTKIKAASDRMRGFEEQLLTSKAAQQNSAVFGSKINKGLNDFLKRLKYKKGLRGGIGKTEANLIAEFSKEAKKVSSLEEAINLKRRFGEAIDDAFPALEHGKATRGDYIKGVAYKIIDEGISEGAKGNKAISNLMKDYKAASLDYRNIKSEKFKDIKKVFGVESVYDLTKKDPTIIVRDMVDQGRTNIFPIMKELADGGMLDWKIIKQAASSEILKRSLNPNTGKFDVNRLRNVWHNKFTPDMKKTLFDKQVIEDIDQMVTYLDVLSSPQRYAFNPSGTAGAIGTAARAAASVPVAGKLAYPIYGIQKAYQQGMAPYYFGAGRLAKMPKPTPEKISSVLESILLGSRVSVPAVREQRNETKDVLNSLRQK